MRSHILGSEAKADRMIFLSLLLWAAVAIWLLPSRGHFLYDEAYFYNEAFRLFNGGGLPNYGPFVSGSTPTALTPGGGLFWLLSPAFILGQTQWGADPRLGTIWIIVLSCMGILFLHRTLIRLRFHFELRWCVCIFLIWSAWHAHHTDRIWNVQLYYFTSPILLALALRIRTSHQSLRSLIFYSFLFGLVSSFSVQIHMGGALAVGCCGLICLLDQQLYFQKNSRFLGVFLSTAFVAFLIPYLPYFFEEYSSDFVNTVRLKDGVPQNSINWSSFGKSLTNPYVYASHFTGRVLTPSDLVGWTALIFQLTSLIFGAFVLTQSFRKNAGVFRVLLFASVLLLPIYFLANKRHYYHHYVSSIIPYFLVCAGVGVHAACLKWPRLRTFFISGTIAWATVGSFLMLHKYLTSDRIDERVLYHLIKTKKLLDQKQPIPIPEPKKNALTWWVIAKNVYKQEMLFQGPNSEICRVAIGHPTSSSQTPIDQNSYFDCR